MKGRLIYSIDEIPTEIDEKTVIIDLTDTGQLGSLFGETQTTLGKLKVTSYQVLLEPNRNIALGCYDIWSKMLTQKKFLCIFANPVEMICLETYANLMSLRIQETLTAFIKWLMMNDYRDIRILFVPNENNKALQKCIKNSL